MYSMFFWIAVFSTIVFGILMLGSVIGFGDTDFDTDVDVDVNMDMDTDSDSESGGDFPIFTVKNLFAFLTMFSWVGMACVKFNITPAISLLIATSSGVVFVLLLSTLFFLVNRLKNENVPSINDAIGQQVQVYLKIPKNGRGQVSVVINGSIQIVEASSKSGKAFKTGETVDIVGANGTVLEVDSLNQNK